MKNWPIMVTTQESVVRMRKPAKTFEDLLVWQKAHLLYLRFIVYP
ncbi:MAG: hypothetical protein AB1815_11285 [Bacillota bacterium]